MKVFSNSTATLLMALILVTPMVAQKGGGKSGGGSHSTPTAAPSTNYNPNYRPSSTESAFDTYTISPAGSAGKPLLINEQPPCFRWPMNPIVSSTVNVKGMSVPAHAQEKFAQGCNAIRDKKLADAEHSLNEAVKVYPQFSAAWVLLGQIAADQGHNEKAVQACTTARNQDSSYLPGYLCLADIAARQQKWSDVAELTNQVLGMHPVKAPAAFYYNCLAYFYLRQFPAAEKSALNALSGVPKQGEAQIHWLLAKIYEQEGKREPEADQLREYLKLSPNAVDAPLARQVLKQIKSEPPDKNAAAEPR